MTDRSPRYAVRVDASTTIGLGHLKRCLALARALRQAGGDVHFVVRVSDVDAAAAVEDAGFDVTRLPRPSGAAIDDAAVPHAAWAGVAAQTDAAQTVQALAARRPDWVIVDHYAFDARWHGAVAAGLSARVAVIDDLADRALAADALIDHNIAPDHRAKYAGRIADGVALLAGPRYALLDAAYAAAPRYVFRDLVQSIGIFMGGADAVDASTLVLAACREHAGYAGPIEIATTRANPNLAALQRRVAADGTASLLVDAPDLAAFFARHDLQIGAAGGATWERCCIGAPSLVLGLAANQQAVLPALAALDVVAVLPPSAPLDAPQIGRAVAALLVDPRRRRAMAEASRQLVDGRGAQRVALALSRSTLDVRPAARDDARMMHAWRNDAATRSVSGDTSVIAWDGHVQWLERVLADPARTLLIGSVGAIPVGVIRFDRSAQGTADVSLYLDPALHGLGLGGALLQAGEAFVTARHGAPAAFHATVLDANVASQRMFAAAGYRRAASGWIKDPITASRRNWTS